MISQYTDTININLEKAGAKIIRKEKQLSISLHRFPVTWSKSFIIILTVNSKQYQPEYAVAVLVGHPEPEKKSVGIFEYILASMLKVYLDVF